MPRWSPPPSGGTCDSSISRRQIHAKAKLGFAVRAELLMTQPGHAEIPFSQDGLPSADANYRLQTGPTFLSVATSHIRMHNLISSYETTMRRTISGVHMPNVPSQSPLETLDSPLQLLPCFPDAAVAERGAHRRCGPRFGAPPKADKEPKKAAKSDAAPPASNFGPRS